MARAFPDAPVHTSLYDPDGTFPEFAALDVRTAPLDHVAPLRQRHRWALPLLAPTFEAMKVDADVVVCSSSGWAHGVRVTGRKIVYCHAPARWLYQTDAYLSQAGTATTTAVRALAPALRRWDQRAARSADRYLVISNHTRAMVRDAYGIDAEVLFPPVALAAAADREPVLGLAPGFYLCVARLLPYKHVDVVVDAFRELADATLVVVGSGPDEARLRERAGRNVRFLQDVTDAQLRWLYASAAALVAASYEDFGLTPVEAAALGTPTVALRHGGYLDTVIEGSTGQFFDDPVAASVAAAVEAFRPETYSLARLHAHASTFAESRFAARLQELVQDPSVSSA
jgi:glycosyltransferase involved in cell wall biosynthesis